MSALELLAALAESMANAPAAPGDVAVGTGAGAGPALGSDSSGSNGDGDHGSGSNGQGGNGPGPNSNGDDGPGPPQGEGNGPPGKGPPTMDDVIEDGKKALEEMGEIFEEVLDIATKSPEERTEDEQTVWDAANPKDTMDRYGSRGKPVSKDGAKDYYDTAKEGVENVQEYNERKTEVLDDILDSKGEVEGDDD